MFIEPTRTRAAPSPKRSSRPLPDKLRKDKQTKIHSQNKKTVQNNIVSMAPFRCPHSGAGVWVYCIAVDGVSPFVLECKEKILFEMRESWSARGSDCSGDRALAQHPWTNCEPERQSSPDVTGLILQKSFSTEASFRLTCLTTCSLTKLSNYTCKHNSTMLHIEVIK